jgi:uncharacterized protein involved in oxidation of intracellular sulfur
VKTLLVINDPPYGTERVYNALRLAHALLKRSETTEVIIFLIADAVLAAKTGQKMPEGYYNLERMLRRVLSSKGAVLLCGTCMDARGMSETELVDGARRSTMDELANATAEARARVKTPFSVARDYGVCRTRGAQGLRPCHRYDWAHGRE